MAMASLLLQLSSSKSTSISELGFVASQLSGIRISPNLPESSNSISFTPTPAIVSQYAHLQGRKRTEQTRYHKTKKLQFVNLQYKRIWWEAGNRYVKLRLSTKTIEKNGLDAVAKKAGIDLCKK